jgi:hypothetical protein
MNESATTATRHNTQNGVFFQGVKPSSQIIEWWSLVTPKNQTPVVARAPGLSFSHLFFSAKVHSWW